MHAFRQSSYASWHKHCMKSTPERVCSDLLIMICQDVKGQVNASSSNVA